METVGQRNSERDSKFGTAENISIHQLLENFRKKLLDLSRRNRLLNFKDGSRTIRVVEELPNAIFDLLVNQEKKLEFSPTDEKLREKFEPHLNHTSSEVGKERPIQRLNIYTLPVQGGNQKSRKFTDNFLQTVHDEKQLEIRLKRIHTEHQRIIEETGTSTLYLAMGFLEWYESDVSEVPRLAPLLLIPVSLDRTRVGNGRTSSLKYLVEYDGQDLQFNISLAQFLKSEFDLLLPEFPSDDEEIVPEDYFGLVADAIKSKKRWKVLREVAVNFFSFAKLLMYLDLDPKRWSAHSNIIQHRLIRELFGVDKIPESYSNADEIEIDENPLFNKIPFILDADSSQQRVIAQAVEGKTIVVEGPPGTGKSQTITNLIGALLDSGKSVLFVAEKLAALQVVKRRLDSVGLGSFVLELHSHKVNKQQVLANLKERINYYINKTNVYAEKKLELNNARIRLNDYVRLVNQYFGKTGLTIFQILWKYDELLTKYPTLCTISIPNLDISREVLNASVETLNQLEKLLRDNPHLFETWKGIDLSNLNPVNQAEFNSALESLLKDLAVFVECAEEVASITAQPLEYPTDIFFTKIRNSQIPTPPSKFFQSVASACSETNCTEFIKTFLNDLEDEAKISHYVNATLPKIDAVDTPTFTELHQAYSDLIECKAGSKSKEDIDSLVIHLARLQQSLESLVNDIYPKLKDLGFREPRSVADYQDAHKILKLLLTNFKAFFIPLVNSSSMDAAFEGVLQNAQDKATQLLINCKKFPGLPSSSQFPSEDEVSTVLKVYNQKEEKWFNFLSSDFRRAQRRARHWLGTLPKDYIKLVDELRNFEMLIKEIHAFESREDLKSSLNYFFQGVRTDWEAIKTFRIWLESARKNSPSSDVFKKICSDFAYFYNTAKEVILSLGSHLEDFTKNASSVFESIKEFSLPRSINLELEKNTQISFLIERILAIKEYFASRLEKFERYLCSTRRPISEFISTFSAESKRRELILSISEREIKIGQLLGDLGTHNLRATGVDETINWAIEVQKNLPPSHAKWLLTDDSLQKFDLVTSKYSSFRFAVEQIIFHFEKLKLFSSTEESWQMSLENELLDPVRLFSTVNKYIESFSSALKWAEVCRAFNRVKKMGFSGCIEAFQIGHIKADQIQNCFLLSFFKAQALAIFTKHPSLGDFSRTEHEILRDKFRTLDLEVQKMSASEIAHKLYSIRIPEGCGVGKVKEYSDLSLIRHELKKKKRHIPVRQLVRRAGYALKAMKPCFMMSPLSVAQFIPSGGIEFDVVVMDEASQLKPEDCLGAIARGGQLIVVGDSNQLPPTQFFDRVSDDIGEQDEETNLDDMESILDGCSKIYRPTQRLLWHYRSEHEDLIRFSNFHFYNQSLILFPSPKSSDASLGVHYQFIENGYFATGRNQREAEELVGAIVHHLENCPNETLGVATFNQEQRDLIRDLLENTLKESPEKWGWYEKALQGNEPFFVKNLENVQGDERDVIFVSCTYGPDRETNKVYQRFGPINSMMGWRRLNVIFTRAKKRLKIFTSLRSDDLIVEDHSSRGIRMFKQYLKFAECKEMVDLGEISDRGPDSEFEISVGDVIRQLGYEYQVNFGVAGFFIDIAVRHPKRRAVYMIGIECDGAAYHSSRSARDRDRLREEILRKKGWRLYRIWSTDWFKNRKSEIDRLANALSEAAISSVNNIVVK